MEVFVPLVVKPALVKPLRGPSVNSGRSLINLSCICFVCLPDLAVKAAKSTNKNNHKHTVCQWIHCFWINVKYLSVWKLLLTLIYPSYLTYEITFLTIGKSSIIPHSLWSMPSGRAFFQKNTYLNPSVHHWNAKICTSKYTVHFFPSFISWRYPAKTAGFCHSASLNVFIFTPNVRRVEILWLRKTDSCSSSLHSILHFSEKKKKLLTSPDDMGKAFNIFLIYSNLD